MQKRCIRGRSAKELRIRRYAGGEVQKKCEINVGGMTEMRYSCRKSTEKYMKNAEEMPEKYKRGTEKCKRSAVEVKKKM